MRAYEFITEEELEELNWKKALATGALAGATALSALSPAQARVSIGPDGQPTQSMAQQLASNPEFKQSADKSDTGLPNQDLQQVDKVDRDDNGNYTIKHDGKEYKAEILPKDFSMEPRGSTKVKVQQAQMGQRGIGNYVAYLMPNGKAYILSGR